MERTTTIVIGAGASAEFGLPVGSQLQSTIAELLDIRFRGYEGLISGDEQIVNICRRQFGEQFDKYQKAAWMIRDGLPLSDSIDNFMDKHAADERVRWLGQMGIAKAIGTAERSSSLFVSESNIYNQLDIKSVSATWPVKLFKILQRRVRKDRLEDLFSNVSFVVFNYDRCLEHFLHWAVRLSYGVSAEEASEIVARADILHPCGTIGDLPWMSRHGDSLVAFGAESLPLINMHQRIRTYTDQIQDSILIDTVKQKIQTSEQIVFLGFSYLPQNMDLLTPSNGFTAHQVLGTAFNLSDFNQRAIVNDIKSRTQSANDLGTVTLVSDTCSSFISNFERAFE